MMTEGFYHPELWTLRLRLMGGTRWSRHKRAHDSLPMRSLAVHFAIITWIIRRRPAAQRDLSFWRLLQSRTWLSLPRSKRACLLGKEAGTVCDHQEMLNFKNYSRLPFWILLKLKHTITELPLLLKLINRVRVRSTYFSASEVAGWWTSCHYLFANTKWCLEPCSVTQYVHHQFIRVHNICFADYYPAWL